MAPEKVAVIGAGPCGLAACKVLAEQGIDYDCLEAGKALGGIWNVEENQGGYRSLQTNTSVLGMCFSDFPFEDGGSAYRSAAEMLVYFGRYADHFNLKSTIKFGYRVEKIEPNSNTTWAVSSAGGEASCYSSIIVATGQYARPRLPHSSVPGTFSGQHFHAREYLDVTAPIDLRGKRIIVVGLGTSAAEVAAELSHPDSPGGCAQQVILSTRSGRWAIPKIINGVPADGRTPHTSIRPPAFLRALPGESGAWVARLFMGYWLKKTWRGLGGSEGLGLPEPAIAPWEDRPTLSLDFIPALQAGRIDVRPGINHFDGSRVVFGDGSHTEADVIVYATGYQLHFPFISKDILGGDATELSLYQRIAHPRHKGLFFVGFSRAMCSLWPLAEQQSRWIAALLNGDFQRPNNQHWLNKAVPVHNSLPVMCNFYTEKLRQEAGFL